MADTGQVNLNPADWPWYCLPAWSVCALYYAASAEAELLDQQAELQLSQQAALETAAQAGIAQAQAETAQQQAAAIGWTVLPVGLGVIALIGGVGAFLWWRRKQDQRPPELSHLSNEELDRLALEMGTEL